MLAQPMDQRATPITISDVAAAAKVSIRTVSRVINDSEAVNQSTRLMVREVIDRMGFTPNSRARGLANGRSYLLGVVQDDPNTHVIGVFQRGIVDCCSKAGYELVVHSSTYGDQRLVDDISNFVHRSHVDGLILLPPLSERADIASAMFRLNVPVVGIAAVRIPSYGAMLISDERRGAEEAAEHFIVLGHRKIAIITGPKHFHSSNEREQGIRAALAKAEIPLPAKFVRDGDYGFQSGFRAACDLLDLAERPTAIFASNDIMAAAAIKAASERGLAVPGDLSVIGFDDSDLAAMLTPALSSVHRPLRDMAWKATEQLLAVIAGADNERLTDHRVPMQLVLRQSTAAPSA
jgi:LacI family transcriptional regulator